MTTAPESTKNRVRHPPQTLPENGSGHSPAPIRTSGQAGPETRMGVSARIEGTAAIRSGRRLDRSGAPFLREPWVQRTIKSHDSGPDLTRHGVHPVHLLAGWRIGSEPDIDRTVRVHQKSIGLAAHAWERLIGLDHRAGLVAVDDDRPEILDRDVGRKMQRGCMPTKPKHARPYQSRSARTRYVWCASGSESTPRMRSVFEASRLLGPAPRPGTRGSSGPGSAIFAGTIYGIPGPAGTCNKPHRFLHYRNWEAGKVRRWCGGTRIWPQITWHPMPNGCVHCGAWKKKFTAQIRHRPERRRTRIAASPCFIGCGGRIRTFDLRVMRRIRPS